MKQPTQCEQSEPTFNEMLNTLALILERGYFTETMTAHLEAIRAILEQHQALRWQKTNETLPEDGSALVTGTFKESGARYFSAFYGWEWFNRDLHKVAHKPDAWILLSALPSVPERVTNVVVVNHD